MSNTNSSSISSSMNNKNNRRVSTGAAPPKDQTARKIEAMEAQRLERRRAMQARKIQRQEESERNLAAGNPGDVDFIGLVQRWREEHANQALPLVPKQPRICVAVRKRPVSDKERDKCDHDSVTVLNPNVWIHAAKFRVDGITKYLDHTDHMFDFAFDETCETLRVYKYTTLPLLEFVFGSGSSSSSKASGNKKSNSLTGSAGGGGNKATVFCYGQTGSGKTYTMQGIQTLLAQDLFALIRDADSRQQSRQAPAVAISVSVVISFFELYGGFVQDLLNDRKRLKVLEDGNGEVQVSGLTERDAADMETFLKILEEGNAARTTHTTQANDTSSRSHAICQIVLRRQAAAGNTTNNSSNKKNIVVGKLSLVDLAGSERGNDTTSHNAQRRAESADINTSLLALKECIRALGECSKHVPYRGSKLTLLLRDCFAGANARTAMIATVSPGASAADHSVNTLRYADRIKEQRQQRTMNSTAAPSSSTKSIATTRPASPVRPVDRLLSSSSRTTRQGQQQQQQPNDNKSASAFLSSSTNSSSTSGNVNRSSSSPTSTTTKNNSSSSNKQQSSQLKQQVQQKVFPMGNCGSGEEEDDVDDLRPGCTLDEFDDLRNEEQDGHQQQQHHHHDDNHTDDKNYDYEDGEWETPENGDTDGVKGEESAGVLKQEEEELLTVHMSNIQENAELLTEEGNMLQAVQRQDATLQEIQEYAETLETILDRKEDLIMYLQSRLATYQEKVLQQQQRQH